jgi:hypothetical protein
LILLILSKNSSGIPVLKKKGPAPQFLLNAALAAPVRYGVPAEAGLGGFFKRASGEAGQVFHDPPRSFSPVPVFNDHTFSIAKKGNQAFFQQVIKKS